MPCYAQRYAQKPFCPEPLGLCQKHCFGAFHVKASLSLNLLSDSSPELPLHRRPLCRYMKQQANTPPARLAGASLSHFDRLKHISVTIPALPSRFNTLQRFGGFLEMHENSLQGKHRALWNNIRHSGCCSSCGLV